MVLDKVVGGAMVDGSSPAVVGGLFREGTGSLVVEDLLVYEAWSQGPKVKGLSAV